MEKYGLVIPDTNGDYKAMERFNDRNTAEQAFKECTVPGKTLVEYVQIGPWSYIGMEVLTEDIYIYTPSVGGEKA